MLMTKILIWTLVACRLLFGRAERFVRTEHVVYHLAQMAHELFAIFGLGVTDGAVAQYLRFVSPTTLSPHSSVRSPPLMSFSADMSV